LNSCETITAPTLPEVDDLQVFGEWLTVPPFAATCRAAALTGTGQYSRCLVDEGIPCCYRSCLSSLGCFCLHPRHQEIVAQTL
jgi:hypothetical protein